MGSVGGDVNQSGRRQPMDNVKYGETRGSSTLTYPRPLPTYVHLSPGNTFQATPHQISLHPKWQLPFSTR